MNGYFKCFAYLVLSLAMALILYIGFNLLYPYQTMTVSSPAPVLNKVVHQGEALQVVIDYEKFTDKAGIVTRTFVDSLIYVMPSYQSNYPVGKKIVTTCSTVIPISLPPGEYYIRVVLEYDFPPFRKVTTSFDTEKFTVIK
jgi:hypothetical protein